MSAKTGENLKKMIYTSIAELPFFDQYKIGGDDDLQLQILNELEMENSENKAGGTNLSILDSSRGNIQINRSEFISKNDNKCKC